MSKPQSVRYFCCLNVQFREGFWNETEPKQLTKCQGQKTTTIKNKQMNMEEMLYHVAPS